MIKLECDYESKDVAKLIAYLSREVIKKGNPYALAKSLKWKSLSVIKPLKHKNRTVFPLLGRIIEVYKEKYKIEAKIVIIINKHE